MCSRLAVLWTTPALACPIMDVDLTMSMLVIADCDMQLLAPLCLLAMTPASGLHPNAPLPAESDHVL